MSNEPRKTGWMVWSGLATVILLILAAFAVSTLKSNAVGPKLPVLKQLPDFTLTNQLGKAVSLSDLRGKVWIADIIFTHCPGPCPRMTKQLSELQNALTNEPGARFVTLTSDPENDTIDVLKKFADRFGANHDRWSFLTGSKKDLYKLATNDGLLLAVQEVKPEDRTSEDDLFVHSTLFVLVDKTGRLRASYESDEANVQERMVQDVQKLLHEWTIFDLPLVNACLNGLSALFLAMGYYFIKTKNQIAHRNCMIAAFSTSVIFLICYLTYHFNAGRTTFKDPAWFRPYYLIILISHTILAVVIVPMILMTMSRGLKAKYELHKKIARWTWPLWMYVSITGVVIYLLLYQIFPQR